MKIVLTGTITGTRDGVEWPRIGVPFDLPDDEALHLIEQRMARAVAVLPAEDVEVAVLADPAVEVRAVPPLEPGPIAPPPAVPVSTGMTTKTVPTGRRGR